MNDPKQFFDSLWAVTAAWAYRQMITRHVIQLPLPNPREMPRDLWPFRAYWLPKKKKSGTKQPASQEKT